MSNYDVSMVRQCFMPFAFYMYMCMAECIRAQNCSTVKPGGNKSFGMRILSCIHSTLGLYSAIHGKLAYLEYVAVCTVPQSVRPMRLMACVQTLQMMPQMLHLTHNHQQMAVPCPPQKRPYMIQIPLKVHAPNLHNLQQ